jgi:hypothetical protein
MERTDTTWTRAIADICEAIYYVCRAIEIIRDLW